MSVQMTNFWPVRRCHCRAAEIAKTYGDCIALVLFGKVLPIIGTLLGRILPVFEDMFPLYPGTMRIGRVKTEAVSSGRIRPLRVFGNCEYEQLVLAAGLSLGSPPPARFSSIRENAPWVFISRISAPASRRWYLATDSCSH